MSEQRYPVLSVTRPWSTWLAHGIKDIENRVWQTNHRGPLWIHAAKSWDDDALDFAEEILGDWVIEDDRFSARAADHPTGIIALVELVNVVPHKGRGSCLCGPWAAYDQHHWRIANPRPLAEPVEARGRLNLWWPDSELQARLAAARFMEVPRG